MGQAGYEARRLTQRNKAFVPKTENFGTKDTPIWGQENESGNVTYDPQLMDLRARWKAATTEEEKDKLDLEYQETFAGNNYSMSLRGLK